MKRMIALIILLSLTIISCSELSEMEARRQRRLRERGRECIYNKRGGLEYCRYIN